MCIKTKEEQKKRTEESEYVIENKYVIVIYPSMLLKTGMLL